MLSLDLKHQKFLEPALVKHLAVGTRSNSEMVFSCFSITLQDLTDFMESQWRPLGLQPLGVPHAYRLWHGGASHDAAHGLRELTSIQARGRWQTLKSLKNYTKGGRLQQLVGSLSNEVQCKAAEAIKSVSRLFL
jgi:hypothetical protein